MTPVAAFRELLEILDRLSIPYLVDGSLASSVHGIARATRDEEVHFQVASAEDSVLRKMLWYQSGGEVSEQQWRDILGIFEIQGERLDLKYLRKWAVWLGVDDLLTRAVSA